MSYEELRVMWLSFGSHLLLISAMCLYLCLQDNSTARTIICCLGIVPIIDALLLKTMIHGTHMGAPLLALSGVLIVLGQLAF